MATWAKFITIGMVPLLLQHAFKEWAVICEALARGNQALILRKGGIAEEKGEFAVQHKRFWLYPTFVHQQSEGIKPEAQTLLLETIAQRPADGVVRLTHFCEVAAVYHVEDLYDALKMAGLHVWSESTIEARFNYRRPGLYVLAVRVFRAQQITELPETESYLGCKSWVELDRGLSTEDAEPVLNDEAFDEVTTKLDILLQPPAYG
ncbi:MAG: DUF1802 family protein [Gemmataceae bacterium]